MRTRLCVSLFACLAAAALAAQQPQDSAPATPQATFRAGTNYVRVDMYATRNGVAVEDLKPEDIEIREDGVVQKIVNFEHVRIHGGAPDSVKVDPNTVAESRQAVADPRARVFVIFLDTLHTHFFGSVNMSSPLVRFIDKLLGPDDLVAVMTPEMSARDLAFGRKTTVISNILQNHTDWGMRGRIKNHDKKEDLYDYCYPPGPGGGGQNLSSPIAQEMKGRRREMLTLDSLEDLVTVLTGMREERKAVLTVSEGWLEYTENKALEQAQPLDSAPPVPSGPLGNPRDPGRTNNSDPRTMLAECELDRIALARMDDRFRLEQIGQEANRGNLSFYTVHPRGLAVTDDVDALTGETFQANDQANLSKRQNSLRFLAENTDGMAIVNTNQIDKGIDRIVDDLSTYYLMSYYSTNAKTDGKFRNISVKVARPGVDVRARKGYRAPTAADLNPARSTSIAKPETPAATATAKALSAAVVDANATFRMRASSWTAAAPGAGNASHLWIVGEVDSRARRQLAWSTGAQVDVTVVAPSGETVVSKKIDMAATDLSFAISVPDGTNVPPGDYSIRVRVRPQADPSLPVNDSARVQVASKSSVLGEGVLWRRGPSTGTKYLMTADPRFTRTERIRLELPTRSTTAATAMLMDRTGKPITIPLQITQRDEDGRDFHWVVVDAALAPLAPGDYAIEVTAGDAQQVTAFKVVP